MLDGLGLVFQRRPTSVNLARIHAPSSTHGIKKEPWSCAHTTDTGIVTTSQSEEVGALDRRSARMKMSSPRKSGHAKRWVRSVIVAIIIGSAASSESAEATGEMRSRLKRIESVSKAPTTSALRHRSEPDNPTESCNR